MATLRFSKHELYTLLEDNAGYCHYCQDITEESGIEPDAEEYMCEACDTDNLYGIETAMIRGWIEQSEVDEYKD